MSRIHISNKVRGIVLHLFSYPLASNQEMSYSFDWIDVSHTDPTRLSGIELNRGVNDPPGQQLREDIGTYLKPGKFLRAVFPDVGNDELSSMAAKLRAYMVGEKDTRYSLLKISDTPSDIYKHSHIGGGTLGHSCMNGVPRKYFDLYDGCPSTQVLYLEEHGQLLGRALLHNKTTRLYDDSIIKFMDRVYVSNDNDMELFFKWARNNNYWRKELQNYESHLLVVSPFDEFSRQSLSVPCPESYYDNVPYMDTFSYYCYCNCNDRILHNNYDDCRDDTLRSTGGGSDRGVICGSDETYYEYHCISCDGGLHSDSDYQWVGDDPVCSGCLDNYYTYCDHCEAYVNDDDIRNVSLDGSTYTTTICEYCLEDRYTQCSHCEGYFESTYDFISGSYAFIDTICDDCSDGMTHCDECDTFHPDSFDSCPRCKKLQRNREVTKRVYIALMSRIQASPMAVKNSPDQFIYNGQLRSLVSGINNIKLETEDEEASPEYISSGQSVQKIRHRTTTYYPNTNTIYNYTDLIDRVLNMIVESKEALKPKPKPKLPSGIFYSLSMACGYSSNLVTEVEFPWEEVV